MARRPLQLLVFVFFAASLTSWGVAKGEPADALLPSVQTIDGASFDQTVERGFSVQALPRSVIREGRVVATAAPFTHFMLRWETSLTGTEQLAFEARASIDGAVWTEWGSVPENDDLSDPEQAPDVRWSATVYAGVAQFWQLRVILTPMEGGPLPVLRTVQVNTLDTRIEEPDLAPNAAYGPSAFDGRRPAFVSRSVWGGSVVDARSVDPRWYPASHVVIHHTADANTLVGNETNWGDRVRAEWSFHTYSRGWGDIGYNWLIDPNGVVYEGRKGSSDTTRDAVGFHDTANYGSMGVALLGSFGRTAQPPTPQAMGTLTYLLAWKANQRGIDPAGEFDLLRMYAVTRVSSRQPKRRGVEYRGASSDHWRNLVSRRSDGGPVGRTTRQCSGCPAWRCHADRSHNADRCGVGRSAYRSYEHSHTDEHSNTHEHGNTHEYGNAYEHGNAHAKPDAAPAHAHRRSGAVERRRRSGRADAGPGDSGWVVAGDRGRGGGATRAAG